MANVYDKLKENGITLPAAPAKGGIYTPVQEFGPACCTVRLRPQAARRHQHDRQAGPESHGGAGQEAARCCMLNLLANLDTKLGDLNRIKRFVKVLAFVNCTEDFDQQPQVVDGGSQLLVELFGEEAGCPARTAVGAKRPARRYRL